MHNNAYHGDSHCMYMSSYVLHSKHIIISVSVMAVTAGHCQDTIAMLQWESMTITTDCYCWSLPGHDSTVTVGVYYC